MPQGVPSNMEDSGLLEIRPLELELPSISPFLGDTWWLETMDWSGNGASSAYGNGRIPPISSGTGVGFVNPPLPPATSGPATGEPAPIVEIPISSGVGAGMVPAVSSGLGSGQPEPITQLITLPSGARQVDPKTLGTSGREVGRIVEEDNKYEEFFAEYPVIVAWDNAALFLHFHLLALPEYRNNPEFVAAARKFSARPTKATPWFRDWIFSRPNILNGDINAPEIYIGLNIASGIPESIKREQNRMDAELGLCPSDPSQWSQCTYAGFYWHRDEIRKMKEQSRWIWQQWQPDWDYLAVDILSWMQGGGHGPYNFAQFGTPTAAGDFPPAPLDLLSPRSFRDPEYSPAIRDGYPLDIQIDKQANLPITTNPFGMGPIMYRNYTLYENFPVFISSEPDNPVLRMRVWVWNKANIDSIVF